MNRDSLRLSEEERTQRKHSDLHNNIECVFCNGDTDTCIMENHYCKWCRQEITFKQLSVMIGLGQPHCNYQQYRREKRISIIKTKKGKHII